MVCLWRAKRFEANSHAFGGWGALLLRGSACSAGANKFDREQCDGADQDSARGPDSGDADQ